MPTTVAAVVVIVTVPLAAIVIVPPPGKVLGLTVGVVRLLLASAIAALGVAVLELLSGTLRLL